MFSQSQRNKNYEITNKQRIIKIQDPVEISFKKLKLTIVDN